MDYKALLEALAKTARENEDKLNELDAINGDGEHGYNLRKTLEYVLNNYKEIEYSPSDFCKKISVLVLSSGGGTAVTIYGACLRRLGIELTATLTNKEVLARAAKSIIEEIKIRGKTAEGQKTMLDAVAPAMNVFSETIVKEPFDIALEKSLYAAKNGLEKTKSMIGTKGRAYYAGERAKGTFDPGAMSFYLIFESFFLFMKTHYFNKTIYELKMGSQ